MEEDKKEKKIEWVPLYLGWDEEENKVKLKVDNKDYFPMAVGLLMRISLESAKDILVKEAKKNESEAES